MTLLENVERTLKIERTYKDEANEHTKKKKMMIVIL